MSKTLNKLTNAQKNRDYPDGQGTFSVNAISKVLKGKCPTEGARASSTWIIGTFVTIIFLILLIYNIRILNILKLNAFEKDEIFAKTGKIETLLKDYAQDINSTFTVVKKSADLLDNLNRELKEANTRISELKRENDSLSFAIENLTKAKNTLFNKISSLEAEIDKLKDGKK